MGARLPAASSALLVNVGKKKKWPSEGDRKKLSPVFYSEAPKCAVSDAWPAPATYHRPFREHCEGGSEPRTSAPRLEFMTQSMFLSIMFVEDSESRRFELNIWLSFSQADLGGTSAQEIFFCFFLERLKFYVSRFVLIASGAEILWRVYLKYCFGSIAFPLSPV